MIIKHYIGISCWFKPHRGSTGFCVPMLQASWWLVGRIWDENAVMNILLSPGQKLKFILGQPSSSSKEIKDKRQLIMSKKLGYATFGELLIILLANGNQLFILSLIYLRCFLLHLTKDSCILKPFLRTLSLVTKVWWLSMSCLI